MSVDSIWSLSMLKKIGATEYEEHHKPDGTGWVTTADPEGDLSCDERSGAERV